MAGPRKQHTSRIGCHQPLGSDFSHCKWLFGSPICIGDFGVPQPGLLRGQKRSPFVMNRLVVDDPTQVVVPNATRPLSFLDCCQYFRVFASAKWSQIIRRKPTHQTPNSGRNLHDPGMELATVRTYNDDNNRRQYNNHTWR